MVKPGLALALWEAVPAPIEYSGRFFQFYYVWLYYFIVKIWEFTSRDLHPQIQNPNKGPESKHTLTLDIRKHWVVICPSIKSYSTPFCKWPFWPLLMRNMVLLSLEVHTLMFQLYILVLLYVVFDFFPDLINYKYWMISVKILHTVFFTTILLFLLYLRVGKFPSIYKYTYWLI